MQSLGGDLDVSLEAVQLFARAAAAAGHGAWALRWPVQRILEDVFAADTPLRTLRIDAEAARTLVEGGERRTGSVSVMAVPRNRLGRA